MKLPQPLIWFIKFVLLACFYFVNGFLVMPLFWDRLVGPSNNLGKGYMQQGGSSWLASYWGHLTNAAMAIAEQSLFIFIVKSLMGNATSEMQERLE